MSPACAAPEDIHRHAAERLFSGAKQTLANKLATAALTEIAYRAAYARGGTWNYPTVWILRGADRGLRSTDINRNLLAKVYP